MSKVAKNLKIILLVFGQVSGLKINLEKGSIVGINTNQEMVSRLALVLDCQDEVVIVLFGFTFRWESKLNKLLGFDG